MTDLEVFVAMLQRAGIPFQQSDAESNEQVTDPGWALVLPAHIRVSIEPRAEHPKIGGYLRFSGDFHFSREGVLLGCSFWE